MAAAQCAELRLCQRPRAGRERGRAGAPDARAVAGSWSPSAPDNDEFRELLDQQRNPRRRHARSPRRARRRPATSAAGPRGAWSSSSTRITSNGDRVRTLVYLQQRIGDALRKKDDAPTALREYEGNLALAQSLAGKPQAKARLGAGAGAGASAHGRHPARRRRPHQARSNTSAHTATRWRRLVKAEPPNVPNWTWRLDLWIGHQRIGDILFAQKDYAGRARRIRVLQRARRGGGPARCRQRRVAALPRQQPRDDRRRAAGAEFRGAGARAIHHRARDLPRRGEGLPARARSATSRSATTGWGWRGSPLGEAGQAQAEFDACLAI